MEPIQRSEAPATARLALAPLCVAFLLLASSVALQAAPGAVLIEAMVVSAFMRTAIAISVLISAVLVLAFWRRHRVSGITMLAGIAAVVLMTVAPTPARSLSKKAADLVHVALYRAALQRQLEDLRRQGTSPAVAVIPIDGFGSMTSGVAYDPTGEILLPADKRSKSWVAATGRTDLSLDSLQAWRIAGSYYGWFHY